MQKKTKKIIQYLDFGPNVNIFLKMKDFEAFL